MTEAIDTAISQAGGIATLASNLGVSTQFCYRCRNRGWFPADRATQIEDLYGIPREKLVKPALREFITGEA